MSDSDPEKNDSTEVRVETLPTKAALDEALADAHDNILPKKKLVVVLLATALSLFLAFVDQTAITVALPYIAEDLDAQETISWAGTASLISNTAFMVLFGRFSDIFSRKYVLVTAMFILGMFQLGVGLARTSSQLYVFRAFCGIGVGGVTSLSMIIVSDIVTLEDRGKYQGILGACVGLGNAFGPFLASAFIVNLSWRKLYFMLCPLMMASMCVVMWIVPYTHQKVSVKEKLLQIDYAGFLTSSVAIIFTLIPLSGGGSTYDWDSPFVISFFCIGGVFILLFLLVEWKHALLPMIPLHLFSISTSLTVLISQNLFFGMCYFSQIYYIPYYLQTVRQFSVTHSSCFMLSLVVPQVTSSIISGQLISRLKHYLPFVYFGYTSWCLGTCLLALWDVNSSTAKVVIPMVFIGMGVGSVFQPTLVAAQAQSYKKDRATVISTRNVLRSMGGAVGLAISSTIITNSFKAELKSKFSSALVTQLSSQIFNVDLTEFNTEQQTVLKAVYMHAIKHSFYYWMGCIGYCFLTTVFVRDNGLQPLDHAKRST